MSGGNVTLRDIYDAVERLEAKLDRRIEKIEARTDSLETFQNRALGIVSVFSVFISLIANFIWTRITGDGK